MAADWSIRKARDTYNTAHWGGGYFDISEAGGVVAYPDRDRSRPPIDLAELAHEARRAGLALPVLIRFVDILDRKSTRLNSSHVKISYAVFCLKKKKKKNAKEEPQKHEQ